MRRILKEAPFVVGVIVALVAAVFLVLVWNGHFVSDEVGPAATQTTGAAKAETHVAGTQAASASPAQAATSAPPKRLSQAPAAPATTSATSARALATVVVKASRGNCWISLRQDSSTGKIYFEGLLAKGKSARASGRRVWLSLGAAGNVDVTLNGARVSVPSGTTSRVLTPAA